jgi:hypothetical protein
MDYVKIIKAFREGQSEAVTIGDPRPAVLIIKRKTAQREPSARVRPRCFAALPMMKNIAAPKNFGLGLTIFLPGEVEALCNIHDNAEESATSYTGKGCVQLDKEAIIVGYYEKGDVNVCSRGVWPCAGLPSGMSLW